MSKKIILIFSILIAVQVIYSFLFPNYGTNDCWKKLDAIDSYKGHFLDSFDKKLVNAVYSLVSDYRLVCDAGGFVLLAHDFPADYFRGRILFINRPLHPFLIHIFSWPLYLISNSYSMTFASAILWNAILFLVAALLFYYLILKFFSKRIAFFSCILLILSPFAHSWLVQPETGVFGLFSLVLSLYLLYNYSVFPSFKKLILFSLIVGILMVGKMNLAIGIFVIIFAIYHYKYKEGLIFFILQFIPFGLWYLWVTKIWGLNFGIQEVSNFGIGVWIFNMLNWPFYKIIAEFVGILPSFLTAVFYGFLLIPVLFSIIGFRYNWDFKKKNILYFGIPLAFLIFFFVMHLYLPRHAFLLFPIIYPTAVAGIDKIAEMFKGNKFYHRKIFYFAAYSLMIIPALMDVFKMYEYLGVSYS